MRCYNAMSVQQLDLKCDTKSKHDAPDMYAKQLAKLGLIAASDSSGYDNCRR